MNQQAKTGIFSDAKERTDKELKAITNQEMYREFEKEMNNQTADFSENCIREMDMENLKAFYMRAKRDQLDFWGFFGINDDNRNDLL